MTSAKIYPLGEKSLPIRFLFMCRWMRHHQMISAPVSSAVAVAGIVLQWFLIEQFAGAPFLALYPTVVLATLWSGLPLGLITATLGGASQWVFFIPHTHPTPILTYVLDAVICIMLIDFVNRSFDRLLEIIEREKESGRGHYMVARELHHRIQNMFAVIIAVIRFSMPRDGLQKSIIDRLNAMAQTNVMISDSEHNGVSLRDLVKPELAVSNHRIRATVTDGVVLGGQLAQHLSLILHELVTNAIKYGSLSVPTGMVVLDIQCSEGKMILRWHEHGGPKVKKPEEGKTGFGTKLLDRFAKGIGSAYISFNASGLMYSLKIESHDIWFADNVMKFQPSQAA